MDLPALLTAELQQRRQRNPRYSLRAFARRLGTHHTTLANILYRRRRLTPRAIRLLGAQLGLSANRIAGACIAENASTILRLVIDERFRPDSRWLAMMTGIALDDVKVALHRLLYERRMRMTAQGTWTGES
jgi:hypothetical protein